ncbi:hypothetical protein SFRURICE_009328 [Spodoptera frugiperda]|nr:hypothetical protein SFRURICE_009328 [Spodoptera frugiperda]
MKVILFFMLCVALVYAKSASLCPADGGHMLIAHEFCNRFYLCNSGHRYLVKMDREEAERQRILTLILSSHTRMCVTKKIT